jgi:hypothetical protein
MEEQCHSQDESPLFQLPGEIRNVIYYFTFTGGDSYSEELSIKERFRPRTNQSRRLLSTCRRVYLEANGMAIEHSTLIVRNGLDIQNKMTEADSQQLGHVLMYFAFQAIRPNILLTWTSRYCSPQHLTVRFRDKNKHIQQMLTDIDVLLSHESESEFIKRLESFALEIYPGLKDPMQYDHWLDVDLRTKSSPLIMRKQIWEYGEDKTRVTIYRMEVIRDKKSSGRVEKVVGMPGLSYFIHDGADKLKESDLQSVALEV